MVDKVFNLGEHGKIQGLARCADSHDLVILREKEEVQHTEVWKNLGQKVGFGMAAAKEQKPSLKTVMA